MREINELQDTYLHKNPLVRLYFKTKVRIALGMANLKKGDKILDFGCGAGWIKNNLIRKGYSVVGYDVVARQSDVGDYRVLAPNKIFASDVFEHISKEEIREIIENFKKMNPKFELIVIIPTENWLSRRVRLFLGKTERVESHITPLDEILRILNSELKLVKKFNFLSVSWIGKFENN